MPTKGEKIFRPTWVMALIYLTSGVVAGEGWLSAVPIAVIVPLGAWPVIVIMRSLAEAQRGAPWLVWLGSLFVLTLSDLLAAGGALVIALWAFDRGPLAGPDPSSILVLGGAAFLGAFLFSVTFSGAFRAFLGRKRQPGEPETL